MFAEEGDSQYCIPTEDVCEGQFQHSHTQELRGAEITI